MSETLRYLRAELVAALKAEEAVVQEAPNDRLHLGRWEGIALALKRLDEIEQRVYQNEMSEAMEQ